MLLIELFLRNIDFVLCCYCKLAHLVKIAGISVRSEKQRSDNLQANLTGLSFLTFCYQMPCSNYITMSVYSFL